MLTIAGGIVIAFFVIRFILASLHSADVSRQQQFMAEMDTRAAERERLRLLALRLRDTHPALFSEAERRVPEPQYTGSPNERVNAVDTTTGKIVAVWGYELRTNPHLRVPMSKHLSDIARAAEEICRERGLPHPDLLPPERTAPAALPQSTRTEIDAAASAWDALSPQKQRRS